MSALSQLFRTVAGSVDAIDAKELQRGAALVVDVREESEWDAGHIPTAKHHPGLPMVNSRGEQGSVR